MNARLRMYKYCYSNEGAIYAKGLCYVKKEVFVSHEIKTLNNFVCRVI